MRLTLRQRASWTAHLFKAVTQQHHLDLQGLFKPFVPEDAVVLDVGAHAGQFSKLFAPWLVAAKSTPSSPPPTQDRS